MSDHSSLINRICFEQVKPKSKTPKIENEAIEFLSEEKIIIESTKEIENSDLDQKFYLNEFKLMNEKSAFILDNTVRIFTRDISRTQRLRVKVRCYRVKLR